MPNVCLKVQIYVLTRNRPEYIIDCLESALAQTYQNFEVVVSDNSTNDATEKILSRYIGSSKFVYKKRGHSYSVYDHFNLCIKESSAEYVMIFHDDDTLIPEALQNMVPILENNPEIAAVSSNASFINSTGQRTGIFNKSLKQDTVFSNPADLVSGFFRVPMEITPFSSYLYRKTCIEKLNLHYSEGRKHADVGFLVKVALQGKIYWIAKELINYRVHGKNDSGIFDIKAIFSLCRFLKKMNFISTSKIIDFKVQNILVWQKHKIKGRASQVPAHTETVLRKYAFSYLIKKPLLLIRFILRIF